MLTMLQQYELDHTDPFGKLKYSISTQPSGQPDSTPIVLDLELQSPPLDLESAHTWVNRAHEAIERAFEASLTDTTRSDLFQEIPQ